MVLGCESIFEVFELDKVLLIWCLMCLFFGLLECFEFCIL